MERPVRLSGKTYKLRSPYVQGAVYVTINNDSDGKPIELFANTKNADSVAWLNAVTRLATMALKLGADPNQVAEELRASFDPRGGYMGMGGNMSLSLVSELGIVMRRHIGEDNERP
jgi:hypothetical protein